MSIASTFRPEPIKIELDGVEYTLVYDLNAFCELEKMYDSVDSVLQMLLGATSQPDMQKVTYLDESVAADTIKIAGVPLSAYVEKIVKLKDAKNTDTLNLLWLGVIHDYAEYDVKGDIKGYSITKATLGKGITLRNLRDVNQKILMTFLRDLLPSDEAKNAEAPEPQEEQEATPHK